MKQPSLDAMFKRACEIVARKSDPSKGKTSAELRVEWKLGEQATRRRIAQFLAAELLIEDKDWRPFEGTMRRIAVYRWKKEALK